MKAQMRVIAAGVMVWLAYSAAEAAKPACWEEFSGAVDKYDLHHMGENLRTNVRSREIAAGIVKDLKTRKKEQGKDEQAEFLAKQVSNFTKDDYEETWQEHEAELGVERVDTLLEIKPKIFNALNYAYLNEGKMLGYRLKSRAEGWTAIVRINDSCKADSLKVSKNEKTVKITPRLCEAADGLRAHQKGFTAASAKGVAAIVARYDGEISADKASLDLMIEGCSKLGPLMGLNKAGGEMPAASVRVD